MKDEQKRQIIALRRDGAGYGSIACQLGLSINTVKSFLPAKRTCRTADRVRL